LLPLPLPFGIMHHAVAFALLLLLFGVGDIGIGVDDLHHSVCITAAVAVYHWRQRRCANRCSALASCVTAPQSVHLQNNRTINLLLADLTAAYTSHYPGQFFVFLLRMPPPHLFCLFFPGCHVTPRCQRPVDFFLSHGNRTLPVAATRLIVFCFFSQNVAMVQWHRPVQHRPVQHRQCKVAAQTCTGHHPEAVTVSFRKLVAVGIRKVVASGCWWLPHYCNYNDLAMREIKPPIAIIVPRASPPHGSGSHPVF